MRGLDYDARVVPAAGFNKAAAELEQMGRRVLAAIIGCDVTDACWARACTAGQYGGCSLRKPGLHRAGAYLIGGDAADARATGLLRQWSISDVTLATESERGQASHELAEEGVRVEGGHCYLDAPTPQALAQSPWQPQAQWGKEARLSTVLAFTEAAQAAWA